MLVLDRGSDEPSQGQLFGTPEVEGEAAEEIDMTFCPCGKPEWYDFFEMPWPECIYFGYANGDPDRSLCAPEQLTLPDEFLKGWIK